MGATTIWERWDGQKTDSTFQDEGMNSFNHYAYGAIGDWMYRISAGIEAAEPGYKKIRIQPNISKKLDYSKASFESLYGTIASGWERKNGKITVKVKIPANTSADILLPTDNLSNVTENGAPFVAGAGKSLNTATEAKRSTLIARGSGEYTFEFAE
jgi:alpha-L-rhamnosidase